MSRSEIDTHCELSTKPGHLLNELARRYEIGPWAARRVRKVTRTIADLAGAREIAAEHVAEAVDWRYGVTSLEGEG